MNPRSVNESLDLIFRARSVALVGASSDPSKLGYMTLESILQAGFEGPVYPVNPKADRILGLKAYPSLLDLPDPADLAVIIVPARFVPEVIRQAGQAGTGGALVLSAGFREAGEDELEAELALAARESGVRFVGPNIQGINYLPNKLCAMFFPVITDRGPLTILSQSGSATAALSEWAVRDGLGINAAINLGNQTDLTETDYLDWFRTDPSTGAIAMYVEGLSNGRGFLKTALETAASKPVAVLKSGHSEAGQKATASHTGSLAGSHRVFAAACRQTGLVVAEDLTSLFDRAKGLAAVNPPLGNRLLSISTSGGMGALAADAAQAEGLVLPELPQAYVQALKEEALAPLSNLANPLDLGYIGIEAFRRAALLADQLDVADTILLNLGDPMPGALEAALDLDKKMSSRLVVSYLGGGEEELASAPLMSRAGLAVFPSPERALRGIGAANWAARYQERRRGLDRPALAEWDRPAVPEGRARSLSEPEAIDLIQAHGLDYPPHRLAGTPQEAAAAATDLGFPVVLKMVAPDLVHKTEVGGVIPGVGSPQEAVKGFQTLTSRHARQRPGMELSGVLVCQEAEPGLEVIVGGLDDPVFGPTVMFGLGGTQAEALADVTFRVAPLDRIDAREMITEIKGRPLLEGWRGAPPPDLEALADLLLAVSRMLTERNDIVELDLNPVRIHHQGLTVLDAHAVLIEAPGKKENHG